MDCNSSIHLCCVKIKSGESIYTTSHLPHSYGDNNQDLLVVLYHIVHFCWVLFTYYSNMSKRQFTLPTLLYCCTYWKTPLHLHPLSLNASCNHHSTFILLETIFFLFLSLNWVGSWVPPPLNGRRRQKGSLICYYNL